ncbi:thioether cross-link-forming SCIFF peptide maturase [Pectinatus frisingensis]|uniref:thioether cross-link-forming SCIFF peptide maturase n=1 Tax=Pectinatus frisingensis TaxID=865 RepID=UPI0015F72F8E|nr:thioether cross-link-forming SCIFF peptide maturase [Pectinatus frisingensis]
MKENIHKFHYKDIYFLLDVNSGAVHVVDAMTADIMDIFDGHNDETVIAQLSGIYKILELAEALSELHELINKGQLFAPDIDVPPVFSEKGIVKSMCLLVAHDCNLRCKYCFADSGEFGADRRLMNNEVGEAAVEYIIRHSGNRQHCEIDFFGGEPLVNMPVVRHLTEYIRNREKETGKIFKLTLTTNGMLLTDENIAFLNDNNISVVISLDGRKEVHDRMRPDVGGNGTYDRVISNFKKLVKSRNDENYYMRGTYTKYNLDFTKDVLSMAKEGFDILSMEPVVAKDADYAILKSDLPRIFAEYDKLVDAYLQYKSKGKGFFFFHFNMDLSNGPCVAKRLSGCGAGHEYYAVAANGDMYPCHQFVGRNKYLLGNVFDGVKNTDLPQYFRNCHVLNKEKCRDCWARFFCSGGCHANADLFNGDIYKPYEIGCELQKKRLECAIAVQAINNMEK